MVNPKKEIASSSSWSDDIDDDHRRVRLRRRRLSHRQTSRSRSSRSSSNRSNCSNRNFRSILSNCQSQIMAGSNQTQHFCLRWNNHTTNFAAAVSELLKTEEFTDVVIATDDGEHIKCHKMVLAACSFYFQDLFSRNCANNRDSIIILSGVNSSEIHAILEYMYHGEVNVIQDQLNTMLRIAQFLRVKGLVNETELTAQIRKAQQQSSSLADLAYVSAAASAAETASNTSANNNSSHSNGYESPAPPVAAPYSIPFKSAVAMWPHLAGMQMPQHPISGHQPSPRNGASSSAPYPAGSYETRGDISPLGRKKMSSYMAHRDTPILRNVLGAGHSDSQLSDRHDSYSNTSNGSIHDSDRRNSFEHSELVGDDDEKPNTSHKNRANGRDPDKRYKQYTRQMIADAMAAVAKKEMSALQAAQRFTIPSRTLYDKLKKAGILPTRSAGIQRAQRGQSSSASSTVTSSMSSGAQFPYSGSMNGHVYGNRNSNIGFSESSESDITGSSASESNRRNSSRHDHSDLPPIPALNGLSLSTRCSSVEEMDIAAVVTARTVTAAATATVTSNSNNADNISDLADSNNDDGAEDLSLSSRRSSDHNVAAAAASVATTSAPVNIQEDEDDESMNQDES